MSQAKASAHPALYRVNWKAHGYPYCGVYVISPMDERWPSKVGISSFASDRLSTMQAAHWKLLAVDWYRYCKTRSQAEAVEKKTHSILVEGGQRMQGEWFNASRNSVVEAVEFAANVLQIELRDSIPCDNVRRFLENKMWLRKGIKSGSSAEKRAFKDTLEEESWFDANRGGHLAHSKRQRAWGE